MTEQRVGFGMDVHALGGPPPLLLGGAVVDEVRGLVGTSDADVLCHAVADALLGAACLGDLGDHFPSNDERWRGAAGLDLLGRATALVADGGWSVVNVDAVVVAQTTPIAPRRPQLRANLAAALRVEPDRVSVKATTTDRLGALGREEGVAAYATVLLTAGPASAAGERE